MVLNAKKMGKYATSSNRVVEFLQQGVNKKITTDRIYLKNSILLAIKERR